MSRVFSSESAGMSAFLKRTAAALIVAGVFSTGALALDSAPTNEFEQKLKAYDLESIAAARQYARELQAFYGADRLDPARPLFDVVLLGVGPDGFEQGLRQVRTENFIRLLVQGFRLGHAHN